MAESDFQFFLYQKESVFGGTAKSKKVVEINYNKVSVHASYSAMLTALHKKTESGFRNLLPVILPKKVFIGMKLYDSEENYYGEITGKEKNFYLVVKPKKGAEDVPNSWREEINLKLTKGGKVSTLSTKKKIEMPPSPKEIREWLDYANSPRLFHASTIKDFFLNGCLGKPGFKIREEDVRTMKFPETTLAKTAGKPFVGKYKRTGGTSEKEKEGGR